MKEAESRINKTKPKLKNRNNQKRKNENNEQEITIGEAVANCKTAPTPRQLSEEMITTIKNGYKDDRLFKEVIAQPEKYKGFKIANDILFYPNVKKELATCIPQNQELITKILSSAHEIVGHLGETKTSDYIRRWYWWPKMAKDIKEFCKTCDRCQVVKTLNTAPYGKLLYILSLY